MVFSKMSALITIFAVIALIMGGTRVAEGQPACVSKLVPCADYLNSTNPPPSCCNPLREAVTKELDCLCNLYENPQLLRSFNINITQALLLPVHCHIPGDLSACKIGAPTSTPSLPPPGVPGGNNGNTAGRIAWTGVSNLLLLLLASTMLF